MSHLVSAAVPAWISSKRRPVYVGSNSLCSPVFTLTAAQICELPPGTISDAVNEHNLTVHWTEKHTHRDCALYTGDV